MAAQFRRTVSPVKERPKWHIELAMPAGVSRNGFLGNRCNLHETILLVMFSSSLVVWYVVRCLVTRSGALLRSNSTRNNRVRTGNRRRERPMMLSHRPLLFPSVLLTMTGSSQLVSCPAMPQKTVRCR